MGRLLSEALQDFSRSFVSIENYRLADDPDDTLALQRAIDDLPDSTGFVSGGGIIMLEGKTYTISSTIIIQKSICIIGAGSDSGTLITLAANSDCNMFEIGKRDSEEPISVTLQGMRITMSGTQADGYSNIVCYNYIRHSHFIDLFLYGATAANFRMTTDEGGALGRNNYFYGCAFENGKGYSVQIAHDYNLNFSHCYFGFGVTASYGLHITMSSNNLSITDCWWLTLNLNGCIYVTSCSYGVIANNRFGGSEECTEGSAHIRLSNCTKFAISDNNVYGGGHNYSIRLDGDCGEIKISDNILAAYAVAPYLFNDKTKVICSGNTMKNYQGDNSTGNATILDGQTYIEVTHNVFTTPDNVIATPQGNEAVWIDTVGATTFRINRAASSGDLVCNWIASVKTY